MIGDEVRRRFRVPKRSGVGVAIVGITQERGVLVAHAVVELNAEGPGGGGCRSRGCENAKRCKIRLIDINPGRIRIFQIGEEEQLVLLDWTADGKPALTPSEERILHKSTIEHRIRTQVVIAEVEVANAVEIVAAGLGDDVDRAEGGKASRQVEVHAGQLELLHGFLREIHAAAAFYHVADVRPIDCDGCVGRQTT